ncbi:mobilization protein, partial [Enterobacter kobei]
SDAILAHEQSMSEAAGRTWLTILMVSALLIGTSGSILWWQGQQITDNYTHLRQQEDTLAKMTARTWGVRYQESSDGRRFLILPPGMQTEAIPYDGTTWIRLKQE